MKFLPIRNVALFVAMELVTLEYEHTEQDAICGHCGDDFLCMHIRWAVKARELLGWPPRAKAEPAVSNV